MKPTIAEMLAYYNKMRFHAPYVLVTEDKEDGKWKVKENNLRDAICAALLKLGEWKQMVNNSRGVEESVALKLVYEIRDFGEEGK